jgi:hypothetical protein
MRSEVKPVHGWFHVAAMLGGEYIAAELHGRLLQSGLYATSTAIHVSIVGSTEQAARLTDYIFSRHTKYDVFFVNSNLQEYEWPALVDMYKMAKNVDMNCFYIHTKGASNCRPDVPADIQKNIRCWRDVMCHFTIGDYKECQHLLDLGYDTVGPLFKFDRHYAGNFWWSKSSYLKTLPYPEGNRMQAEGWVTECGKPKVFNQFSVDSDDLYGFNGGNPFKEWRQSV